MKSTAFCACSKEPVRSPRRNDTSARTHEKNARATPRFLTRASSSSRSHHRAATSSRSAYTSASNASIADSGPHDPLSDGRAACSTCSASVAEASFGPYVSTFAKAVTDFSIGPDVRLTVRVFTGSGWGRRARVGCEHASHSSIARIPVPAVERRIRSSASVASSTWQFHSIGCTREVTSRSESCPARIAGTTVLSRRPAAEGLTRHSTRTSFAAIAARPCTSTQARCASSRYRNAVSICSSRSACSAASSNTGTIHGFSEWSAITR